MHWLIPTLALLASSAAATPPADPVAEALDAYIDEIEAEGAAGVVLVAQGNEPRFRRGFGHADCSGTTPMTAEHLVMMGSITKELTQLLSYVLVEEGKLAFQDPIGRYLAGLPPQLAAITVEQLVHHTSGLPDLIDEGGHPVPYTVEYDYLPVSRAQLVERAAKAELIFPPGSREEYSNLGYNLLGAVLEIAAGETYEGLLASRIFDKAGMTDTGYWFTDGRQRSFAEGCLAGGKRWGSPLLDRMWGPEGASWNLKAAGGLLTTVDDLARWLGGLGDGRFLGPEMQRRYLDERLVVSSTLGERVMASAGSNGIFNAVAYWVESSDLRIVGVTSRSDHLAEREGIARRVIKTGFQYLEAQADR